MKGNNKIVWTDEMISFLKNNYSCMTNREIAKALGLRLTVTRNKLYELGLKRIEMEYWTDEQIDYLVKNYKLMGDTEITQYFNKNFPKKKGWTKKHIEKKRRYLKLKRSIEEQDKIKDRNVKNGSYSINHWRRWAGRSAAIGTVRIWRMNGYEIPYIKYREGLGWLNYMKYSHYVWILNNGPIPKGKKIIHKDKDTTNCDITNLQCVTFSELVKLNCVKNLSWYCGRIAKGDEEYKKFLLENPEVLEVHKLQIKLRKRIKEKINNINK